MGTRQIDEDQSCIQIGALAPLNPPGWIDGGKHLMEGLKWAIEEVNSSGGISGRPLKLLVRDTAADPRKAAAVDELAALGVTALAGEYHSIVAALLPPELRPSAFHTPARLPS